MRADCPARNAASALVLFSLAHLSTMGKADSGSCPAKKALPRSNLHPQRRLSKPFQMLKQASTNKAARAPRRSRWRPAPIFVESEFVIFPIVSAVAVVQTGANTRGHCSPVRHVGALPSMPAKESQRNRSGLGNGPGFQRSSDTGIPNWFIRGKAAELDPTRKATAGPLAGMNRQ